MTSGNGFVQSRPHKEPPLTGRSGGSLTVVSTRYTRRDSGAWATLLIMLTVWPPLA